MPPGRPVTSETLVLPETFDVGEFLLDYWQKKPLLIRGAALQDPISPEELAGLACEDFVESRLVSHQPESDTWQMLHGPFEEAEFTSLPETHYSLLVQAVDHWHAGVRSLLQAFSFIPSWRLDDIMVSYATTGGNVGPHFDHYDVFLIQGLGRKQWLVGDPCDSSTPLDTSSGLRLLTGFETRQEYVLEPGDVLYLPPGLAHHGIALEPGLTYSVGFRAPSASEVLTDLSETISQGLSADLRYRDDALDSSGHPGEIPDSAAETVRRMFIEQCMGALEDTAAVKRWFGQHMTQPRYPELQEEFAHDGELDTAAFRQMLEAGLIRQNPLSRFAWTRDTGLTLFVDGQAVDCPADWLELLHCLCAGHGNKLCVPQRFLADDHALNLLQALYNQGSLIDNQDHDIT